MESTPPASSDDEREEPSRSVQPNGPDEDRSRAPTGALRRRRGLLVAVGAAVLVVGLIVTAVTRNGDDDRRVGAAPDGTGTDESEGSTTSEEPSSGGSTTGGPSSTGSTESDPADAGTFGDGVWGVGSDVPPGRYIATGIGDGGCDWARLADPTGDTVVAAETDVANQAVVDILASDAAFRSTGCGTWTAYSAPDPPPLVTIDEGDWVVGEQVEPGAYRTPRSARCTWARASGFEHIPAELTQDQDTNLALEGPFFVTLVDGERFTTRSCDPWTRAD
jgi:hypothetical protein